MKRFFLFFMPAFVLCALVCGCGQNLPDGMPPLYRVELKFQYDDGTPVGNAFVRLIREEPLPQGLFFMGKTSKNGIFKASAYGHFNGVPEGHYTIVITKSEESASMFGDVSPNDPNEEMVWQAKRDTEKRDIYTLVEQKYAEIDSSDCILHVKKGGGKYTLTVGKPIRELIGETKPNGQNPDEITPDRFVEEN